ncbi:hypothetical protein DPX39_110143000 [Trypanosoma brucei equiperdum]|uniref:Transmembrane protein n=1 Tax=Trypanosoma brucei equiperdum TaxID=630700 RepID=A0A3L6KUD1_9TRYP|nr:hypothetical protein DPX39_110143000 [Trypanosoma brucei equiperdum]
MSARESESRDGVSCVSSVVEEETTSPWRHNEIERYLPYTIGRETAYVALASPDTVSPETSISGHCSTFARATSEADGRHRVISDVYCGDGGSGSGRTGGCDVERISYVNDCDGAEYSGVKTSSVTPVADSVRSMEYGVGYGSPLLHDTQELRVSWCYQRDDRAAGGDFTPAFTVSPVITPWQHPGNGRKERDVVKSAPLPPNCCWLWPDIREEKDGSSSYDVGWRGLKVTEGVPRVNYTDGVPDYLEPLLFRDHLPKNSLKGTEGPAEGPTPRTPGKKVKRVRFSETVVGSVSFVETHNEIQVIVESHYPWLALAGLVIAVTFFVLHWGVIAVIAGPREGIERITAVSLVDFVSSGLASLIMLLFLALLWRPGREEVDVISSCSGISRVMCVAFCGALATLSLVCMFMFTNSAVGFVCFCCCPFVGTHLYEVLKLHNVPLLSTMASILIVWAFAALVIGCFVEGDAVTFRCLWPVAIAISGGAAMCVYLFQFRSVGREVSGLFLSFVTLVTVTLMLALASYASGGFSLPTQSTQSSLFVLVMTDFSSVLFSVFFLVLYHLIYHCSSPFFSRLCVPGSFVFGGAISLLISRLLLESVVFWPLEATGSILMMAGSALIFVAEYHQWQSAGAIAGVE